MTSLTAEEAVEFLRTLTPNTGLNAPASLRLRQAADLITRQAAEIGRLRAAMAAIKDGLDAKGSLIGSGEMQEIAEAALSLSSSHNSSTP